jgi:hypothetical protein
VEFLTAIFSIVNQPKGMGPKTGPGGNSSVGWGTKVKRLAGWQGTVTPMQPYGTPVFEQSKSRLTGSPD